MRRNKRHDSNRTRFGLTTPGTVSPPTGDTNQTPYGGLRLRSGAGFTGPAGSKPQAVILDIDGTLEDWGSVPSPAVIDWCRDHHAAGRVLIVITARTHEHDYRRSFDWLVRHLPFPFIGPFHRGADDPRYASEFKKELAEHLSAIYTIVGAADDNRYVNAMWRHWADTLHPDVPFDLLECSYSADTPRSTLWGTAAQDDERWELENEAYARHPHLTWRDIEGMDIEALRGLALLPVEEHQGVTL